MAEVDVRDHGARGDGRSDDTAALQRAIDAGRGRMVRFGSGTFLVSRLLLPDDTWLDLGAAVLRRYGNREGAAAGATVRNADLRGGNRRITIHGGYIEGGEDSTGRLLGFVGCRDVDVRGLVVRKGASDFVDWMMTFESCRDVHVSEVRVQGGTELGEDGLHISGCTGVVVSNCTIESGDDALAIAQDFGQTRPVGQVVVSNCVLRSRRAHMVRVTVAPDEVHGISGVVLTGLVGSAPGGGSSGNPVLIADESRGGRVREVLVADVLVDARGTLGDACRVADVVDSDFRGVRVVGADAHAFLVERCTGLSFTDCSASGPRPGNGNSAWTVVGSRRLTLVGCSSQDADVHGFEVTGDSAADVQMLGCRSVRPGAYAFHLSGVDGVALLGCTTQGGVQGIDCDEQSPPRGLRVIGCHFADHADQAVKNLPLDSSSWGNTTGGGTAAAANRVVGPLGFGDAGPSGRPSVRGVRGGNEALAGLLGALAQLGLITDETEE
ncbi:glycosyl hydrolase family 28-related protein [Geodermatophilus sp. SYSU D01119]